MKTATAIVCLLAVILGSTFESATSDDQDVLVGLTRILEKLEAFATGKNFVSDIDAQELMEVSRLYEKWDPALKAAARQSPLMHMVIDFAIIPMKWLPFQILEDSTLIGRHLNRVEEAYKRFRPAFLGERIGNKNFKIKVNRSMSLFRLLAGLDKENEITTKHFMDAKAEWETWRARLEELTTVEDIFASLKELESILNYLNAPVFLPLFAHVYPIVTKKSNVDDLVALYHQKLWEDGGIKIVDGVPTLFRGAKTPTAQAAGFTHVVTA